MLALQSSRFSGNPAVVRKLSGAQFRSALVEFDEFGKRTSVASFPGLDAGLPVFVNEFWTAKQRVACSLHEISYRACFKPQLPRFFIGRLTNPGEVVHDPFMGRGTTVLEAALLGRKPVGCDVNPLSRILVKPRLAPPDIPQVERRLAKLDLGRTPGKTRDDLSVFYHPKTLRQIVNLRNYLLEKEADGKLDEADDWIRMIATNRLTGHSPGFFSVYTLPPNQALSIESQRKINKKRNQSPPERDVVSIILKKSKSLLAGVGAGSIMRLRETASGARLLAGSADAAPEIPDASVSLVVTSPPFLDVVDYSKDNWLRCWFNGIDAAAVPIWRLKKAEAWQRAMENVFSELRRVLTPGGFVAFEVGEVRGGELLMETLVVPAAAAAGLRPLLIMINDQQFTKTANCWGVSNLRKGTNTNRIVLLQKDD